MTPFNDAIAFDALLDVCRKHGAVQYRVHDGEDWVGQKTYIRFVVKKQVNSTGEDWLHCYDVDGARLGAFYIIWNNGEPAELVTDHSANAFCEAVWAEWNSKFD